MKNILFLVVLLLASVEVAGQNTPVDAAMAEQYRTRIGLNDSRPDYSIKKIDEKVTGPRLAQLLRFFLESLRQPSFNRQASSIVAEQDERLKNVYVGIRKAKLAGISKSGNTIQVRYDVWLNKNVVHLHQTVLTFTFVDGVSESTSVNELFSDMGHYIQMKEEFK